MTPMHQKRPKGPLEAPHSANCPHTRDSSAPGRQDVGHPMTHMHRRDKPRARIACCTRPMARTKLQLEADRRAEVARRLLAEDLRRFREDAGLSQRLVASVAGVDASLVSRVESLDAHPSIEMYARIVAALGADLHVRAYPNTGPALRDRHQVRMGEILRSQTQLRWSTVPEIAVRRPVRGWIDLVALDAAADLLVATELESTLRRLEQLIRWHAEKAAALPSSDAWARLVAGRREPRISQLLVVRWTRANRDAVADARQLMRDAYPANPADAFASLTGDARWPGPSLCWVRIDGPRPALLPDAW